VITLWGHDLDDALQQLGYPNISRQEYTTEAGFVPN